MYGRPTKKSRGTLWLCIFPFFKKAERNIAKGYLLQGLAWDPTILTGVPPLAFLGTSKSGDRFRSILNTCIGNPQNPPGKQLVTLLKRHAQKRDNQQIRAVVSVASKSHFPVKPIANSDLGTKIPFRWPHPEKQNNTLHHQQNTRLNQTKHC